MIPRVFLVVLIVAIAVVLMLPGCASTEGYFGEVLQDNQEEEKPQ